MPRARKDLIVWEQGSYYHLYNRGARRLPIFRERDNYLFVLDRLKHYCQKFELTTIAYCLMPNHYHLLVRQNGEQRAGLLPQRVFNSYSKAYNKRYDHSGTLFEDRYQARQANDESYLRHLCRYIHANPVTDGLVKKPEDWPYSNYLEWIGERNGMLVDRKFIREQFADPSDYRAFLAEILER